MFQINYISAKPSHFFLIKVGILFSLPIPYSILVASERRAESIGKNQIEKKKKHRAKVGGSFQKIIIYGLSGILFGYMIPRTNSLDSPPDPNLPAVSIPLSDISPHSPPPPQSRDLLSSSGREKSVPWNREKPSQPKEGSERSFLSKEIKCGGGHHCWLFLNTDMKKEKESS